MCAADIRCDRRILARNLCESHYKAARYLKTVDAFPLVNTPRLKECSVSDCSLPVSSKSMCSAHYARARAGKVLDSPIKRRNPPSPCSVSGCERLRRRNGYCSQHDRRMKKYGDPGPAEIKKMDAGRGCAVEGCPHPHWQSKVCRSHYSNLAKAARRAQRLSTALPFTAEQLQQRLSMYGGRCWICGGPGSDADHVKPLSKGGPHILANLRPACRSCNSRKNAQWPYTPSKAGGVSPNYRK